MKRKFTNFFILFIVLLITISITNKTNVVAKTTDDVILSRINNLYSLVGEKYFTTDQKSAGSSDERSRNSNVIATNWFKNTFNIYGLNVSQFPGSPRTYPEAKSCSGFASFAEWYIFKNSDTDNIRINTLSKMSFNYSNVSTYAKIGDIISLSGTKSDGSVAGHEFIYISSNSNGLYVLDSNWGNSCKVTKHYIYYNYCTTFQIGRATSRDSVTETPTYADLGADFYAVILNTEHWKTISLESDQSVKIRPEDGTSKQVWRFIRQSDGSYLILSAETGKALELYAGETTNGTPIKACSEDWGGNYQRWYLLPQDNGYCIVSKHYYGTKNIVMDMTSFDAHEGTEIKGWEKNNGSNQIWSIYRGEEIQLSPSTLNVNVGNSLTNTSFTWSEVYGETGYNLKIWKDTFQNGNAYMILENVDSGYEVQLPAGNYYAYVDAWNFFGWKQSNILQFTVNQAYKISYDVNRGDNAPSMQTKTYGENVKISANVPTLYGYKFSSWNTKADGSGIRYYPEDVYSDNCDITLYAQWNKLVDVVSGVYKLHTALDDNFILDQQATKNAESNIQIYTNDNCEVKYFRIIKQGDYYSIQSVYSEKYIDIKTPFYNGSNIKTWHSNTSDEQKWVFEEAENGYVYVHSLSGYYMDIDGDSAENNANVSARCFVGDKSQKWRLEDCTAYVYPQEGIYKLHSALDDNMVLDIEGNSLANGANVQIYQNDDSQVKYFNIIKNNNQYNIQSELSKKYLDIKTPLVNGSNIHLYEKCTNVEEQWNFEDAGNGYVYIQSNTGYYVDVQNDEAVNHSNVFASHFVGDKSQKWRLERYYKIIYNVDNTTVSTQMKEYDKSFVIIDIIPTKNGYEFLGWNTKADGSGIFYNSGDTYSDNEDATLYAQWKKIEPATNSTVNYTNGIYIVNTEFINISNGKVIIAGYKGNKLVALEINDYSEDFKPVVLDGDIDKIKVMVWDNNAKMKPVTTAEEISYTDFK